MKTRTSLKWSFGIEAGQFALQFTASVIIARLLAPSELGVFALAMSANALLYVLRDFGIGAYLVREPDLDTQKIRTAFGLWITLSWPAGLLLLFFRDAIASAVGAPEATDVIFLLALTFFVTPFGQPAYSLLSRDLRFDAIHHVSLLSTLTGTILSVTLAYKGMSYMAMAWGIIATSLVRTALLYGYHPEHMGMLPSLKHWRTVMHFGGYVTASSVVSSLSAEGPKFIIGNLLGPSAVALLDKASQMPSMLRQGLLNPIARVMTPTLSRSVRDQMNIDAAIEKVMHYTNALLWPSYLAMGLIAVPMVVFIFGENWRPSGELLPYILAAQAVYLIFPTPYQVLQPFGAVRKIFLINLLTLTINIIGVTVGAMYGLEIYAKMLFGIAALVTVIHYFGIRSHWRPNLYELLTAHFRTAMMSVITCAPMAAIVYLVEFDWGLSQFAGLLATLPPTWLAAIHLTRHPLRIECNAIMRKICS